LNSIDLKMTFYAVTPVATQKQLRQFGWMVGTVLILIGGWQLYRQIHPTARIVLWSVGGFLVLSGLLTPKILAPGYKIWMRLATVLGWINTRILLGLIFYLIFTPVGLVMRLSGRDPLTQRIDRAADSYWVDRSPILLENQDQRVNKISILAEFWYFLKVRKKFWLMPIFVILVLLGILLVFAQTSPLAPFIYTLF